MIEATQTASDKYYSNLKPCAHCGSVPEWKHQSSIGWAVVCTCGINTPFMPEQKDAFNLWQMRTQPKKKELDLIQFMNQPSDGYQE